MSIVNQVGTGTMISRRSALLLLEGRPASILLSDLASLLIIRVPNPRSSAVFPNITQDIERMTALRKSTLHLLAGGPVTLEPSGWQRPQMGYSLLLPVSPVALPGRSLGQHMVAILAGAGNSLRMSPHMVCIRTDVLTGYGALGAQINPVPAAVSEPGTVSAPAALARLATLGLYT